MSSFWVVVLVGAALVLGILATFTFFAWMIGGPPQW